MRNQRIIRSLICIIIILLTFSAYACTHEYPETPNISPSDNSPEQGNDSPTISYQEPHAITYDSLCDIKEADATGVPVRVEGTLWLISSTNPAGISAELEDNNCAIELWLDAAVWDTWSEEERMALKNGNRVLVIGLLFSYDGQITVDVSDPMVLVEAAITGVDRPIDTAKYPVYDFGEWWLQPQTFHFGENYFSDDIDLKRVSVLHDWSFQNSNKDIPYGEYMCYENIAKRVAEAHELGVKVEVCISILDIWYNREEGRSLTWEVATDNELFQSSAIDLYGEHLQYDDPPGFIGCTNHPIWQQYLETRLKEAIDLGYDGVLIDDYEGSSRWLSNTYLGMGGLEGSNGGCFCEYCESGFRNYLEKIYTTAELEELGIRDIDSFDYSHFLVDDGWTTETLGIEAAKFYGMEHPLAEIKVPLYEDYYDFQTEEVLDFLRWLHNSVNTYARDKYDKEITWSTVMGETSYFAHNFFSEFDRNVGELQNFSYPPHGSDAYWYRLDYDALNTPRVRSSTSAPLPVAVINKFETENLLQIKRAEAFANRGAWIEFNWVAIEGSNDAEMEASFRSDSRLVNRYNSFYLDHPELFDFQNQKSIAEVAVVYSSASIHYDMIAHQNCFGGISEILTDLHVQFDPLLAGDGIACPDLIDTEKLTDYEIVILPNTLAITEAQAESLVSYIQGGGTVIALGEVGQLNERGEPLKNEELSDLLGKPFSYYGSGQFYTMWEHEFRSESIIAEDIHDAATAYQVFYVEYHEAVNSIMEDIFDEEPMENFSETVATAIRRQIDDIIKVSLDTKIVSGDLTKDIGVQGYYDTNSPKVIFHLPNYDYDLISDTVNTNKNIHLSIKLPYIMEVNSVTLLSPDLEQSEELAFQIVNGRIDFTVPLLQIWDVIIVE